MLKHFLSVGGRILLSENMIIVTIVVWSVKGHFKRLEAGLASVSEQVGKLSQALLSVETRHADRLNSIEKRVEKLEDHGKQRRLAPLSPGEGNT